MKCAWDAFLTNVPPKFRGEVDKLGSQELEELRLRLGQPAELILHGRAHLLSTVTTAEDIQFVVNTASRYSPWSAGTISKGYLTTQGGHRIGLCGVCVVQAGQVTGLRQVTSLCMRVARSFQGIGASAPRKGSLLILGAPGCGKTTLLRDIIRLRSSDGTPVAVVDERGELFPDHSVFESGPRTDILIGCNKAQGIDMALRTMGPKCIAVDEITVAEDCQALLKACWCGVDLLATAHATNTWDYKHRLVYRPLLESGLFTQVLVVKADKTWHMERV